MRAAIFTWLLAASMPVVAQPVATCPDAPAGWSRRAPLAAAAVPAGLAHAQLALGRGADLALRPSAGLRFAAPPERPAAAGSHGGLAGFTVAEPGTYRVSLGTGAWIDVLREGRPMTSVAHGHGSACAGVRKMVDFKLGRGPHVLQISGNQGAAIPVMVARVK